MVLGTAARSGAKAKQVLNFFDEEPVLEAQTRMSTRASPANDEGREAETHVECGPLVVQSLLRVSVRRNLARTWSTTVMLPTRRMSTSVRTSDRER